MIVLSDDERWELIQFIDKIEGETLAYAARLRAMADALQAAGNPSLLDELESMQIEFTRSVGS